MNDKINYKSAQYILGSIGTLGGLYYAFKGNKGFWGYAGFAILGGFAGSIIGGLYDNAMKPAVEKSLPTPTPTENDVKNELVAVQTTRPMEQSGIVSTEIASIDEQMKNFL
jgi:hypothetical protein